MYYYKWKNNYANVLGRYNNDIFIKNVKHIFDMYIFLHVDINISIVSYEIFLKEMHNVARTMQRFFLTPQFKIKYGCYSYTIIVRWTTTSDSYTAISVHYIPTMT